jgi:hypothetical protein
MGEVQKQSNSEYYTPLSEPFKSTYSKFILLNIVKIKVTEMFGMDSEYF